MSSTFDPYTQNLTFIGPGDVPINATVDFIDMYIQYGVQSCANMGAQLGATIITLIILLMLTPPGKRRSPVFILNSTALVSNIAWLVSSLVFFSTQWFEIYNIATGDFSNVSTSAYANAVIQCISENIMFAAIYGSLGLQVNVIFTGTREIYRWMVLASTLIVSLVSYGFHLAQWVYNMEDIMSSQSNANFEWLQNINTIMITATICFFSAIFAIKLGYAMRRRRRLGVRGFGPMQVIFIMSCQTMVLPGE
jgi:pheromone alpha factor receptor